MIDAVRRFSEAQRPADTTCRGGAGDRLRARWVPLAAVGICVPSGRHRSLCS